MFAKSTDEKIPALYCNDYYLFSEYVNKDIQEVSRKLIVLLNFVLYFLLPHSPINYNNKTKHAYTCSL